MGCGGWGGGGVRRDGGRWEVAVEVEVEGYGADYSHLNAIANCTASSGSDSRTSFS